MKIIVLLLATLLAATNVVRAQDGTNQLGGERSQLVKKFKYQSGEIDLGNGLAKLMVPKEFKFLGAEDTETMLVKVWHNPPSAKKPLGMLLPADTTGSNRWAVIIEYTEDGFVKDDDAGKINYDDLLKQMQKGIAEGNEARKEKGFPTVTLIGWAAPPHYDAATHKLYWAKQARFEGEDADTLNYCIRMLGRKGVLELNAIADINQFEAIDKQTPEILSMVDFKEGSRYADFNPKSDKVAVYGIAALVAGGVLAKFGFFKLFWVGLLAAKKFVIIGVIAVVAFLKKMFNRSDTTVR